MSSLDPCSDAGAGNAPLLALGASPDTALRLTGLAAAYAGSGWGRVSRVERGAATVLSDRGAVIVRTTEPVAVGDWCVIRPSGEQTAARTPLYDVVTVLPRRTELVRRA